MKWSLVGSQAVAETLEQSVDRIDVLRWAAETVHPGVRDGCHIASPTRFAAEYQVYQ